MQFGLLRTFAKQTSEFTSRFTDFVSEIDKLGVQDAQARRRGGVIPYLLVSRKSSGYSTLDLCPLGSKVSWTPHGRIAGSSECVYREIFE